MLCAACHGFDGRLRGNALAGGEAPGEMRSKLSEATGPLLRRYSTT